jgi:hypothetical protein
VDDTAQDSAPAERHRSSARRGIVLVVLAIVVGLVVWWTSSNLMCDQECEDGLTEGDVIGVLSMLYGGLAFIVTLVVGGLALVVAEGWPRRGERRR